MKNEEIHIPTLEYAMKIITRSNDSAPSVLWDKLKELKDLHHPKELKKDRKAKKIEFLKKNMEMAHAVYNYEDRAFAKVSDMNFLSNELAVNARFEIGYSPNTLSIDILNSLNTVYCEINKIGSKWSLSKGAALPKWCKFNGKCLESESCKEETSCVHNKNKVKPKADFEVIETEGLVLSAEYCKPKWCQKDGDCTEHICQDDRECEHDSERKNLLGLLYNKSYVEHDCPHCNASFGSSAMLYTHINTFHKD